MTMGEPLSDDQLRSYAAMVPALECVKALGAAIAIRRLLGEVERLRAAARERDVPMAAIVRPWQRPGDGKRAWKISLSSTEAEAIAMVRRIAGPAPPAEARGRDEGMS